MANRSFNKKLAIALGALIGGAGALNAVPVSAMENVISSEERNEYLETVVQSATRLGIYSAINKRMMNNEEYKKTLKALCSEQLPMYDILEALYDSQGGTKFVGRNAIIQDLIFRMNDSEVQKRIKKMASKLYEDILKK